MTKENKTNWGFLAVIVALFGIPVAIWKSSRIGKVIFIFCIIGITSYAITKISKVGLNAYYNFEIKKETESVLESFEVSRLKLREINENMLSFENEAKEEINRRIQEIVEELTASIKKEHRNLSSRISELLAEIEELESHIDVIKEEERIAIKERLISLNEKVKIKKKNVDSIEIRTELELIASNISLLSYEEKQRLYKELEKIGFKIEEEKQRFYSAATGGYITFGGMY